MTRPAAVSRRTCLAFALGLAARTAFPRAADPAGVIEEVGPTGTYKTICSFSTLVGTSPTGVILGSDGRLYGTTVGGGAYGRGTVFRVDAHRRIHVLHAF